MSILVQSYHALSAARQRRWRLVRRLLPRRVRWLYEGCLEVPGQLWYVDRKLLYGAIREHKPQVVFEVGTWYGGGSTYFISQALFENGSGVLHTIEENAEAHERAKENYQRHLPHLLPHVRFHAGKSTEVYPALLRETAKVDAVFLDGALDAKQTLTEFEMFAPRLEPGALLLAHDWDNEKMALLRPKLEAAAEWNLQARATAPESVGFVVWRRAEKK
ncbi:MAG: class I SAM-dependent methyltransferase [Acidobacteria bacterium]|nr:class I SAM-dependent methyltransferase [Acidobacteriota bacterium]